MWLLCAPTAAQDVSQALKAALSGDLPRAESLLAPADEPEVMMALGLVRQLQLRLPEAAELYAKAAPAYPAEAAFRLGLLEPPAQAAVRYRQALQADPGLSMARYNLAVATDTSPGPYEGKAGWCLVRFPLRTPLRFLELRSENLVQARWLAQSQELQLACEFTRNPDPSLWLARARLAPPERRTVLAWRYLLATLEPTGRDSDLAVWGPGTIHGKPSLTLGVLPSGLVVDAADDSSLGIRVPGGGHALHVTPDGVVRVWTRERSIPIGKLAVQGRVISGYRVTRPPAWDLLPAEVVEYALTGPFESLERRRERASRLTGLFGLQEQGNLALQAGDLAAAEGFWRKALERDPDWELTAYNLAVVKLLQGDVRAARAELDALQERLPGSRVALQERLRLAVLMQNPYEALSVAQAYGKAYPHDPYPVYAAAEILGDGERLEPALEIIRGLVANHPELAEPRYLLAALLGRDGQTAAQNEQLQWLIDQDPWPYRAQRMLAANLERLGQRELALGLYRQYLGSYWPILFEPTTYFEVDAHVRELTSP